VRGAVAQTHHLPLDYFERDAAKNSGEPMPRASIFQRIARWLDL